MLSPPQALPTSIELVLPLDLELEEARPVGHRRARLFDADSNNTCTFVSVCMRGTTLLVIYKGRTAGPVAVRYDPDHCVVTREARPAQEPVGLGAI